MIDFSTLPEKKKRLNISPLMTAVFATVAFAVMVSIPVIAQVVFKMDGTMVLGVVNAVVVTLIAYAIIKAFWIMFNNLNYQKRQLRAFAEKNGFRYLEPGVDQVDISYFAPQLTIIQDPSMAYLRFVISGNINNDDFDLYSIVGSNKGASTNSRFTFPITVLRKSVAKDYEYFVSNDSTGSRESIEKLFVMSGLSW